MGFSCLMSTYKKDSPIQLKECLESLVNQTLPADEIVLVKDGELSLELESVLEHYQDKLPFNFIELPNNKGLGNALNVGLLSCKYDIVIRMDADDICALNRFEIQYQFLSKNPEIDILGSWAWEINNQGKIVGERRYPENHEKLLELIWACPINHPTVIYRRNKILSIGSYNIKIKRRQDYELWFRAAENGLKF